MMLREVAFDTRQEVKIRLFEDVSTREFVPQCRRKSSLSGTSTLQIDDMG